MATLALPTREFMRIAAQSRAIQPDLAQRLDHAVTALGGVDMRLVQRKALANDLLNRHAWRQRAIRVLKHDLHARTHRAALVARNVQQRVAKETQVAALCCLQTQQRLRERGLAGAGFTHDAERLAFAQLQRHGIDRGERICPEPAGKPGAMALVDDRQLVGFEQHGRKRH